MTLRRVLALGFLVCAVPRLHAEDFLDRVDETLTVSALDEKLRVRLSGTINLEYYHIDEPPFALVDTMQRDLFNPRLTLFLDAQLGPSVYLFVQSRLDRGFDPSSGDAQVRLDEYALRITPWEDARFNVQIGKFSTVVGGWMPRHLSWDNPFVGAPLPYENITAISDIETPTGPEDFSPDHGDDSYEYNPVIWNAVYTSGVSISGKLGKFEYAAEVKNAALSSRPDSWDVTSLGFDYPSYGARIGWRPNHLWNIGFSASRGAYLRPEVERQLPRGQSVGDYEQFTLGQDISFAWRHLQVWAEFYQVRFEVPRIGDADTFAYYVEAKYKFTPELFVATRWNQQLFAAVPDGGGGERSWGRDIWRFDLALGYRFTPHTMLKLQYSVQHEAGPRDYGHNWAAQFTVRF